MKTHKIVSDDRNQKFTDLTREVYCYSKDHRLATFHKVTYYWKKVNCKHCIKKHENEQTNKTNM